MSTLTQKDKLDLLQVLQKIADGDEHSKHEPDYPSAPDLTPSDDEISALFGNLQMSSDAASSNISFLKKLP